MRLAFSAPLWLWNGKGAWHFVTLPADEAGLIRMAVPRRGFGSVRVRARIGGSEFATSLFPDRKSGSYLLPVKAAVREKERLSPGEDVAVTLSLDF